MLFGMFFGCMKKLDEYSLMSMMYDKKSRNTSQEV